MQVRERKRGEPVLLKFARFVTDGNVGSANL